MNAQYMRKQRGVSLLGLIAGCIILAVVALLGMKVAPEVIEYLAIVKTAKATAQDPSSREAAVADIRRSFEKRAIIDNIKSITPADLDITKEGGEVVIAFAYEKKIPLYGPVSLLIDFEGSSAK